MRSPPDRSALTSPRPRASAIAYAATAGAPSTSSHSPPALNSPDRTRSSVCTVCSAVHAYGGEERALDIAPGRHRLREPVDITLMDGPVSDAHAHAARTPERPALEQELVVGGQGLEADDPASGLGKKQLHQLAPVRAIQGGQVGRREAALGLCGPTLRRGIGH